MDISKLPHSKNVEDRRGEKPSRKPRFTLAQLVQRGLAVAFNVITGSRLAKDAGVDDVNNMKFKRRIK